VFKSDDGSGGVATYLTLDGSAEKILIQKSTVFTGGGMDYGVDGTGADVIFYGDTSGRNMKWDQSEDHLLFTDNTKLKFGTGGDLQIYHDGNHSYIQDNGTGDLLVYFDNEFKVIKNGSSETCIEATVDGSVELYHDNSKKFETTSTGITITGVAVTDGLDLGDNEKIRLGASQDLEIFHDGSHSRIKDVGTGHLILNATDFVVNNSGDSANMIIATDGGSVDLYHSGNKKFETTSTGATVTGVLAVNSGTTDTVATFTSSDASVAVDFVATDNSMQIATSSTDGILKNNGGGSLRFFNNGSERVRVDSSGSVGIGTTNPQFNLHVDASGSGVIAGFFNDTDTTSEEALLQVGGTLTDNYGVMFGAKPEADTPSVQDHAFIVKTNDSTGTDHTERFRISSDGKVGIGTTSPSSLLHLESASSPTLRLVDTTNSVTLLAFAQDANTGFGNFSNHPLIFYTNSTTALTLDTSQNATFAGDVILGDDKNLDFGAATDFRIVHNSTTNVNHISSKLDRQLSLNANNINITNQANTENMARFIADGAVELYHDNSKKFETTSAGVEISGSLTIDGDGSSNAEITSSTASSIVTLNVGGFTGTPSLARDVKVFVNSASGSRTEALHIDSSQNATFAGNVSLADSKKIKVGNSSDLEIFHNGTDSAILNANGDLFITNEANDKDIIFRSDDGSGGFTEYFRLDGSITSMVASKDIVFNDSVRAEFGSAGDFDIYHDGTDTHLENATGGINITNNANDSYISLATDNGSGGVSQYILLDGNTVTTQLLTQKVMIPNLPTSDPNNAGQLYNDSGTLKISAG
jgi:hypothetical protein